MTKHMTGTREEWLAARIELLEAEKELTRRSDELARRRQELPWVRVDKEYRCRGRRSRRMGWTFPWASSFGSDFNFDFNVSFTEEQQREGGIEYNYERGGHAMDAAAEIPQPVIQNAVMTGTDVATYTRDRPGMSAFVLEDGIVYHTYSTYARGLDGLWGMYQWLDRAPRGRNETGVWWSRHDEYNKR